MVLTDAPPTAYSALFRAFIEQTLKRSLAQVQAYTGAPPEDVREQALHALSFGLKLPAAWSLARALLLDLAPKMEQVGHRHDWLAVLETAIRHSEAVGDIDFFAECQLQVAILHRLLSNFAQAQIWVRASIENFTKIGRRRELARAINELAWLQQLQKNYDQATQSVEQALALLDHDDIERGMSYRIYGMILIGLHQYAEAERYHRAAFALFQTYGDVRRTAWSLQNVGLALSRQQQYQAALGYYEQADTLLSTIQDLFHWAVVRLNQGLAYSFTKQYSQAIQCYQQAEAAFLKLEDKFYLSRLYTDLGLDWLEVNELTKAKQAFQMSVHLAEELNDRSWQLNAMDGLAMACLKQQAYEEAIQILERAWQALPAIQGDANYDYLVQSISQHLSAAREAIALTTV